MWKRYLRWSGWIAMAALVAACGGRPTATAEPTEVKEPERTATPTEAQAAADEAELETGEETMSFELTSTVFEDGNAIPVRYTCDGEDLSPPLSWSQPPEGSQSLALIMDDPDAPGGTWDHWLLFDLPAEPSGLEEGVESVETRADGSVHGANSWGNVGYGGPCPPGGTHRYFFKLYALDGTLGLAAGSAKSELLAAMEGHVLATAELMGTYER